MFFLAARFFFRDVHLALKPGYFDKNHFYPRQPKSVQCNPPKNRRRMNIPASRGFFQIYMNLAGLIVIVPIFDKIRIDERFSIPVHIII
jgi:hypothetical protein